MRSSPSQHPFDGVICFGGEDWWYHNRGHYDMQMMRRLGRHVPVLYVNSIGMRVPQPSEGRMFVRRIRRKMRSISRGSCIVERNFTVLSPPVLPSRLGLLATRPLLLRAVRRAASHAAVQRPLVWVACPTAAPLVDALHPAAVIYQRTDRYESFGGVESRRISSFDRTLKSRADLTLFCSRHLFDAERTQCRAAAFVDHGVDLERFTAAEHLPEPAEIASIPRPRIGFVGSIDAHTFDHDLMGELARRVPTAHFLLIGPCSLERRWENVSNISMLGQVPLESVPRYLCACDVLMMPWNRSSWIESCNPVKLKEYLAAGRPIVSTDFPEARRYDGFIRRVKDPAEFARAIESALNEPFDPAPRREYVRDQSWDSKVNEVLDRLAALAIELKPRLMQKPERPYTPVSGTSTSETSKASPPEARRSLSPSRSRSPGTCTISHQSCQPKPQTDLAAFIVLCGGLSPSSLVAATARCTLDLWLTAERTVLDCWLDRFEELANKSAVRPPVRIVHDAVLPPPWIVRNERVDRHINVEREPRPYRGAAGVLADLTRRYHENEHVLVVEGARYSTAGLAEMLQRHQDAGADVTAGINHDDSPAGVYIIRRGALATVPSAGFLDLKEQWLEQVNDAGAIVQAVRLAGRGVLPLRDRAQFLMAAKAAGQPEAICGSGSRASGGGALPEPPALDGSLRVICPGAIVGPDAVVIDSVVMPGAVIGPRAVIARSVVCPHSHVQAGTDIADAVVRAGQRLSDQWPVYA